MSLQTLRHVARHSPRTPGLLILALGLILPASTSPALAQYTGHAATDQQKKAKVEPRAVSVLEWIGEPGKPVASRIVPVAVWINGSYQDGGLYLAHPEPLTVQTDTLYELEKAGVPQGTFYIAGGQDVGGAWFGYGQWKPLGAPKPVKKLPQSKVPPQVVQDHDPDRPRFKGGDPKSSGESTSSSSTTTTTPASGTDPSTSSSSPSNTDPDKPTLHRRTDSGDSTSNTTASSSGSTSSGNASSTNSSSKNTSSTNSTDDNDPDKPTLHRRDSTVSDSGAGTAPEDPDRPRLKKHSDATTAGNGALDGSPVSSVNEADPDRPRMSRGQPATAEKALDMSKLNALPANLQQMAAISDPAAREQHVFTYPWPDPSEATQMQSAVEALATKVVLANGAPPSTSPPAPAKRTVVGTKSTLARQVTAKSLPVAFQEKDFRAYELTYGGGATLVFTAKALVGPNNAGVTLEKYVTIIAQPDFDGAPQLRLQSVTDAKHLDITPRMRLVDAVDTKGDNQAELLFELRRATDRQFAIYHVRGSHAEQAFATDSLPIGTPNHPGTDSN